MTVGSVVLVVVLGIAVFAIAAGAIGREARRLDKLAPRSVYIVEEAAEFVADSLPALSQAQLTHEEVQGLLVGDHIQDLRGLIFTDSVLKAGNVARDIQTCAVRFLDKRHRESLVFQVDDDSSLAWLC